MANDISKIVRLNAIIEITKAQQHASDIFTSAIINNDIALLNSFLRLVLTRPIENFPITIVALMIAFQAEDASAAQLLIQHPNAYYFVNFAEPKHGITPLHIAAYNGNMALVNFLLNNGANPLSTTKNRRTPLMLAQRQNHPLVVNRLQAPNLSNNLRLPGISWFKRPTTHILPNRMEDMSLPHLALLMDIYASDARNIKPDVALGNPPLTHVYPVLNPKPQDNEFNLLNIAPTMK